MLIPSGAALALSILGATIVAFGANALAANYGGEMMNVAPRSPHDWQRIRGRKVDAVEIEILAEPIGENAEISGVIVRGRSFAHKHLEPLGRHAG